MKYYLLKTKSNTSQIIYASEDGVHIKEYYCQIADKWVTHNGALLPFKIMGKQKLSKRKLLKSNNLNNLLLITNL